MRAPHDRDDATFRPATRVVRAGLPDASPGAPYLPGPVFAAPFHLPGDPAQTPFSYGRFTNPTWEHYERALGALDGGTAVLFPSGMAATAAALATLAAPGTHVVMPSDCYYTTRIVTGQQFPGAWFAAQSITVHAAPTHGDALADALQTASALGVVSVLWLETPTNPHLDVCDIRELSARATAIGARVVVDNTTATALLQQPLALGADVVVSSDTKAATGHADVVLGHVSVHDAALVEPLRTWRTRMGVIPGAMEAWLAHRSLATLDVRLQRQCDSAERVAALLAAHRAVRVVRYPGLDADRAHAVARMQMRRFGGVVSFELASGAAARRFFDSARLVYEATSFGGIHTSGEARARWGGDAVPDGYIRLSVGLEDIDDLLDDLTRALDAAAAVP